MGGVSIGNGVSLEDVPSYSDIASNISSLLPSALMAGTYTVATLPTPDSTTLDKYARVTDLFGEKRDLVLCSQANGLYFWQPVRAEYAKSLSGNQNITLTPLKSPSVLFCTGTLTANRTLTLDSSLAYPGATFEIAFNGVLGLFGLSIIGLDAGGILSLVAGGRQRIFFDGSTQTYKQF